MKSSILMTLVATLIALNAAAGDGFTQQQLESTYNKITPAMGLLKYSSEVTNSNTGESSRRDRNALALVVSSDGLVMAHGHMKLEGNEPFNISVTLGQGDDEKEYDAVLLRKPDDVNVVFLRLQSDTPLNLPYVRFAPTSSLRLGETVGVFGLLGETLDFNRGLQVVHIGSVLEKPRKTFCLDTSVRFGFVSGPVVDTAGRITGVVGFDLSTAEGGDLYVRSGHPLVYQSELFAKYIKNPPSETEIDEGEDHAWLGVFTQPLTDDFAAYWSLDPKGGLIVSTIVPGSPAEGSGLQLGDVIVKFNGTPVVAKQDRDVLGFTKLVREAGAGKETEIRILRNGEPMTLTVKLGVRPRTSQDAEEFIDETFGLTVREITRDVRIRLNLSEDVHGVIVRSVKSGSTAQLARMRPGVIIMGMGDYPVRNLKDFEDAVNTLREQQPAEVAVFARLGSETGFFRLEPVWK
jgi:serine protease Do